MSVGHFAGEDMGPGSAEQRRRLVKVFGVTALACVAAACAVVAMGSGDNDKPVESSMYHMWLGSNGLPLSPRKQRSLLFQFCTTNFVTEAEARYCYARLLSVGNPSGPVKYAGQPQYDSEQVVSPLFTFAPPPMEEGGAEGGGEGGEAPAEGEEAKMGQPVQLRMETDPRKQQLHELATRKVAAERKVTLPQGLGI